MLLQLMQLAPSLILIDIDTTLTIIPLWEVLNLIGIMWGNLQEDIKLSIVSLDGDFNPEKLSDQLRIRNPLLKFASSFIRMDLLLVWPNWKQPTISDKFI